MQISHFFTAIKTCPIDRSSLGRTNVQLTNAFHGAIVKAGSIRCVKAVAHFLTLIVVKKRLIFVCFSAKGCRAL